MSRAKFNVGAARVHLQTLMKSGVLSNALAKKAMSMRHKGHMVSKGVPGNHIKIICHPDDMPRVKRPNKLFKTFSIPVLFSGGFDGLGYAVGLGKLWKEEGWRRVLKEVTYKFNKKNVKKVDDELSKLTESNLELAREIEKLYQLRDGLKK